MKKFVILLCCICATFSVAKAQLIEDDILYDDSTRVVFTYGDKYYLGVNQNITTGIKSYYIVLISGTKLSKNDPVLIKLKSGEILKFAINLVDKVTIKEGETSLMAFPNGFGVSLLGTFSIEESNTYFGYFNVTDADLDKIETGVEVMRYPTFDDFEEYRWHKDKMGKFIKKSHTLIEERLSKPFGSNIYEGL